jgi:benzoate transport
LFVPCGGGIHARRYGRGRWLETHTLQDQLFAGYAGKVMTSLIRDPKDVFSNAPMRWRQMLVVAITLGLNALDGFDVLTISFASPGIAAEWHITRAALGVVLSMELIGMAFGSLALGSVADRIGRRPTILICLTMMAAGTYFATLAHGTTGLSVWRVATGIGIGGMLATMNAVASEFSSYQRRELSVAIMAIGYTIGATIGGALAAWLLRDHDWRAVFYLAAIATAMFIPIVFVCIPESVHWLVAMRPYNALARLNLTLAKMGHAVVVQLPPLEDKKMERANKNLFSRELWQFTVLSTIAYSFHIFTYYFIVKWLPSIVVDMGEPASTAAGVLVWTNAGGVLGAITFGLLAKKVGLRRLTIVVMLLAAASVVAFGRAGSDIGVLKIICMGAGYCITAGVSGTYGIFARGFPADARAFGTGFGIGVGRAASVLAPISAGFLFRSGFSVPTISMFMAGGSLVSAVAVWLLAFPADRLTWIQDT